MLFSVYCWIINILNVFWNYHNTSATKFLKSDDIYKGWNVKFEIVWCMRLKCQKLHTQKILIRLHTIVFLKDCLKQFFICSLYQNDFLSCSSIYKCFFYTWFVTILVKIFFTFLIHRKKRKTLRPINFGTYYMIKNCFLKVWWRNIYGT